MTEAELRERVAQMSARFLADRELSPKEDSVIPKEYLKDDDYHNGFAGWLLTIFELAERPEVDGDGDGTPGPDSDITQESGLDTLLD